MFIEMLVVAHLVKKFANCFGAHRFIKVLTTACYMFMFYKKSLWTKSHKLFHLRS